MPSPRIFVSSTCYDLKYIRENLKYFVRNLGYEAVLSEEGSIFYDPTLHVQDACLAEVPACQLVVLIIGGRLGGRYKETDKSITNAEYDAAFRAKTPIFALVEKSVLEQYIVYKSNKENISVDASKISYPAVDSTRIFDFLEEVQTKAVNNALFPFSDFEEMQSYLRLQWASMMFRFLTTESEAKRVGDMLSALSAATEKIEFLSRQVVNSVGNQMTKVSVEFYDLLFQNDAIRDLGYWKLRPSPKSILTHATLDKFCGGKIEVKEDEEPGELSITGGGPPYRLSSARYARNKKLYQSAREVLIGRLEAKGITLAEFLREEAPAAKS